MKCCSCVAILVKRDEKLPCQQFMYMEVVGCKDVGDFDSGGEIQNNHSCRNWTFFSRVSVKHTDHKALKMSISSPSSCSRLFIWKEDKDCLFLFKANTSHLFVALSSYQL